MSDFLTALHDCDFEAADEFLAHGQDVNARIGPRGSTALAAVTGNRGWAAFDYLLDHGARIDCADDDGTTLAHYVVSSAGHQGEQSAVGVMRYLIGRGLQIDRMNSDGYTPLLWAVDAGNLDMTRLLLENGANPNARRLGLSMGESAMEFAINKRESEADALVSMLLEHGAAADGLIRHSKLGVISFLSAAIYARRAFVATRLMEAQGMPVDSKLEFFDNRTLLQIFSKDIPNRQHVVGALERMRGKRALQEISDLMDQAVVAPSSTRASRSYGGMGL